MRDRVGGVRSGQVVAASYIGYQAAEDGLPRAAVDERGMRLHGPSHLCGAAAGPAARHCYFQPFGAATLYEEKLQSTELCDMPRSA